MSERRDLAGAWRAIDELRRRITADEEQTRLYRGKLDEMVRTDEIDAAVRSALRGERRMSFTVAQKVGAFIVAVVLLAGSIKGLIGL